jgi:hypothetical protein
MVNAISAEGSPPPDSNSLEARGIQAEFNSNDTTTIVWNNLVTNDYVLLDVLNDSTYEVYRSPSILNSSNIDLIEPIATGIEACTTDDDYSECSGKAHSLTWQSPPGTEGSFHYGVVTVTSDGTLFNNLTIGYSQSSPVFEDIHPIWAPLRVIAEYDTANESTTISWVNANEVGLDVPSNRTIWVWRHLEPVEGNIWNEIDSTIVATLEHDTTSFVMQHTEAVEEDAYYSVTYRFDTWEDSRFLGTNTLEEPIREDNVAPLMLGELSASFNSFTGNTSLSWTAGAVEEDLTTQIWRASSAFSEIDSDGVELIVELPFNASAYENEIATGTNGEFWYAVTLRDALGNRINSLGSSHPTNGPIFETTVGPTLSTPSGLMAEVLSSGITTLSWTPVSGVSNALYHVWMSNAGVVDETCLGNTCQLLVSTNNTVLEVMTPEGVERETWYAVTIEAQWAESSDSYDSRIIISGRNAMESSVMEDADPPSEISDLRAVFNGPSLTTELSWTGNDANSTYSIWRKAGDWSTQSAWNMSQGGWELVETIIGGSGTIEATYTTASSNSALFATYAVSVMDSIGNEDRNLLSGAVVLVKEDMLTPSLSVGIIPAGSSTATEQVWLSNGMSISFNEVTTGVGSVVIQGGELLSEVNCRLLGNQTSMTTAFTPAVNEGNTWICSIDIQASMNIEVRANDTSSNPSYLVVSLSPVASQSLTQPTDDTHEGLGGESASDSSSAALESENSILKIGFSLLALLLFIVVVIMLLKNRPPLPPKGIPSKKEDDWAERFIG